MRHAQCKAEKRSRSQLQALVKVVVLPLSSTGITTSWHQQQSTGIKLKLQRIHAGASKSAKPAASTSALAGPAVPTTRAKPSMAPAAKRSSPSKAVVVVDACRFSTVSKLGLGLLVVLRASWVCTSIQELDPCPV